MSGGDSQHFRYFRLRQIRGAGQPDKAILVSAALQNPAGIGQRGTVIEAERYPFPVSNQREHTVGRPLRCAIADDEEVEVVVNEFVGRREARTNRRARGADLSRDGGIELIDKSLELRCGGFAQSLPVAKGIDLCAPHLAGFEVNRAGESHPFPASFVPPCLKFANDPFVATRRVVQADLAEVDLIRPKTL